METPPKPIFDINKQRQFFASPLTSVKVCLDLDPDSDIDDVEMKPVVIHVDLEQPPHPMVSYISC